MMSILKILANTLMLSTLICLVIGLVIGFFIAVEWVYRTYGLIPAGIGTVIIISLGFAIYHNAHPYDDSEQGG